MSEEKIPAKIERTVDEATRKAAELYADNTVLRTFVVSIPYVGRGVRHDNRDRRSKGHQRTDL
jgi:hypothetical protein